MQILRHSLAFAISGLLAFSSQLAVAAESAFTAPPQETVLATLVKNHPRILANAHDFAAIKTESENDPTMKQWRVAFLHEADKILPEPASVYAIPDGLRLLATSRRVLVRVSTLAMAYRLTGDARYSERAWKELDAAAHFPDWNSQRHFLDTAEMTHAFAIGYDWLYDVWTPEQREELRDAIIQKGLDPALQFYRKNPRGGWQARTNNWNQVCNGGIATGALAIAESEPKIAAEIVHDALASIPRAMASFDPDGATPEGPGYWGYATEYNVLFIAALNSALGTDFGLSKLGSFDKTGFFPVVTKSPTQKAFNYADAHETQGSLPQLLWFARRYDQPSLAQYQLPFANHHPVAEDFIWGRWWLAHPPKATAKPPLASYFRGSEIVVMRSAWNDPNALFVGFKLGKNGVSHAHLDLGSFVFDALGERWASDLGSDDYNLPAYFGNLRWTYYRLRAEGHNTLVFNPDEKPDQNDRADCKVSRFSGRDPDRIFAISNLTDAYSANAQKVERGIAMLHRREVLIQDEIDTAKPTDSWWFLHTPAQIEISKDGRSATLSQDGKKIAARILSPLTAKFSETPTSPLSGTPNPPNQNPNDGISTLTIHWKNSGKTTLAVLLSPQLDSSQKEIALKIKPLGDW